MKKCKQGYYYCYTEKKCKKIPMGYHIGSRGYLAKDNDNDNEGEDTTKNGNGNGGNGNGGGTVSEEGLRDWFGKSKSKDGKKGWVNVVTGGTCASDKPGEGTPKCVSSAKRASMTKAERLSAQRRKKEADPGQQKKTGAAKPTYVSTDPKKKMNKEEVEVMEAKDKKGKGSGSKDACYHKVKSRYSVWPSAYASGALVKCRKVGAANWGNKSEGINYSLFTSKADEILRENNELIVDNAAQYFFNEGINEDGLAIFIEELGVENFVEFVHDLAEDSELIEAYALTGKKKTPKRLPKGTQPAKTTKKTIARGDSKIKAASPSGAFKKRPAAAKAVETAKEKQPEKKPVKSNLVKGVADTLARGALSAWKGHKAAMKKKKEGGSVASQVGTGLATAAGAMLKKGKKHLSDHYNYSNWRDEFKAMDYEFTDIIKPEPLVSEGIMPDPIDPKAHRQAQRQQKIRNMTQSPNENEAKVAKKKAKGPDLIGEEQIEEGQKCWKGYEKKGTKKMFGKTYNNCVKKEETEIEEKKDPCWDTHKQVGMKKKGGKMVPNCVPKEENEIDEMISTSGVRRYDTPEAQKSIRQRKEKEQKRKGRISPERTPEGDRVIRGRDARGSYKMVKGVKFYEDFEKEVPSGDIKKLVKKAVKRIDQNVSGHVDKNDKSMGEYGEFVPSPDGKSRVVTSVKRESFSDWRKEIEEGAAWTKKSGKSESGGLNEKGRKSYERENPGSDLKAPSKKVGNPRRKSFCARMKGMKKKLTSSKTANDPDSRINKSLRAWNC